MIWRMNIGIRDSESRPCAMVLPPGISRAARSGSTWIHCSSPVASANLSMRSWLISSQSLTPTSAPTADLISLKSEKPRIPRLRPCLLHSNFHFRNSVRNIEFGLGIGPDVGKAYAGRALQKGCAAIQKADHRQVGNHEIDRPH